MEKELDIETKYHKLAAEYSKVRSQATVLKKAVLDEQTRNVELNDLVKRHEQTMRKREQEMESLTFRNEQLTKRIMVLQQELQASTAPGKKNKNKFSETMSHNDSLSQSVINEELQKKILENAQLISDITEKESELLDHKEKVKSLQDSVSNLRKDLVYKDDFHRQVNESCKREIEDLKKVIQKLSTGSTTSNNHGEPAENNTVENVKFWKNEADRWKAECDILRSKPHSNDDKLTNYYENQLSSILETKTLLHSEVNSTWAENVSLKARLEHITEEYSKMKNSMEINYEELITTNNNYKSQLDAMTEHLAAQNEKITNQCDEIQILKHKLSLKK